MDVGAAFAAKVGCQVDAFVCLGTDGLDEIGARQGDDVLRGFGGREEL